MFHHDSEELDNHFGTRPDQDLSFTTLLRITNGPQSIGEHIHSNHAYALTTNRRNVTERQTTQIALYKLSIKGTD